MNPLPGTQTWTGISVRLDFQDLYRFSASFSVNIGSAPWSASRAISKVPRRRSLLVSGMVVCVTKPGAADCVLKGVRRHKHGVGLRDARDFLGCHHRTLVRRGAIGFPIDSSIRSSKRTYFAKLLVHSVCMSGDIPFEKNADSHVVTVSKNGKETRILAGVANDEEEDDDEDGILTKTNRYLQEKRVLNNASQAWNFWRRPYEGEEEKGEEEEDEELKYYGSDSDDEDEICGFFDEEDQEVLTKEFEDGHPSSAGRLTEARECTSTLVSQLCARVQAGDGFTVTLSDITALYQFPLDKFQQLAIEGFLKGSSVVVCAPTSSGKTLIAEAAAAATLARRKRLFYTTPLKALSNQKLREFRKLFGESNVGLLTGDAAMNREAPIMVMTTEILRNMLYSRSPGNLNEGENGLEDVTTVVLDEVHYLSDVSRGTVWEETVIYCPKGAQLICLSATVANPEELAGWIARVHGSTALVTGTKRPVPLKWQFSTRYDLIPLLSDEGTEMNRRLTSINSPQGISNVSFGIDNIELEEGRRTQARNILHEVSSRPNEARQSLGLRRNYSGWEGAEGKLPEGALQLIRRRQVPRVQDTLAQMVTRDMLPAIWFIFSRRACDTAVRYLQDIDLLSVGESWQVREAIIEFELEHPDSVRESAVGPLLRGVAAHHAGCLPTWKAFVEDLFQRGLVKIVFATETLAAGINMPARTTVLSSLSKRGDAGHVLLSSNAMLQMAGRAGRRGIDEQGHVVVVQTPFQGADECCKLLFAGADPLVSQFTATYGMVLNLLAGGKVARLSDSCEIENLQAVPFGRTLTEARELIEQTFGNYVGSEVIQVARKQLAKLEGEVERLVQKARAESYPPILETRLAEVELQEYIDLKDQLKHQKALLEKMLNQMKVPTFDDTSSESNLHQEVPAAETLVAEKRKEISTLRKKLKRTQGYRDNHEMVVLQKFRLEKIAQLKAKASRVSDRIRQMAPSGWKEFLQVVEVLNAAGAVNMERSELLPLGQTASAVRGENELWLALVFRSESVCGLTSAQLAGVCGSLLSDGMKTRSEYGISTRYEASRSVQEWTWAMEIEVEKLLLLQDEHGVQIPCHIDIQFAGMVEAWAAGVTWKELMAECHMDEGDVARLLRRSIDLLARIPRMPHIDPDVVKLARHATKVMDRPPISELLG